MNTNTHTVMDQVNVVKSDFGRELGALVEKFTSRLIQITVQSSIQELTELAPPSVRGTAPSVPPPPMSAVIESDETEEEGGEKGGSLPFYRGRPVSDVNSIVDRIVEVLQNSPNGMKTIELKNRVRADQTNYAKAVHLLLQDRKLKKIGQKRGTTYKLLATNAQAA